MQEVRHASQNADSVYPFCIARDGKRGTLNQHFVTHVVPSGWLQHRPGGGLYLRYHQIKEIVQSRILSLNAVAVDLD